MNPETHAFYKGLLDTVLRAQSEKNPNFGEIYENVLSILNQATLSASSDTLLTDATASLEKISKLLSLDVMHSIDYELIDDKNTRRQLRLDNLAMSRVRYGLKQTASGVLFDDYCRFAHYQAEELVNFFYSKKFGNITAAQQFVVNNNESYRNNIASRKVAAQISDISHQYKIFAFNQTHPFKEYWVLQSVSYVRNEASHRCSVIGDKEDGLMCDYEIKQLARKFRKDLTPADQQIYDKCDKIIFRREANYDKVSSALNTLYKKVISTLT